MMNQMSQEMINLIIKIVFAVASILITGYLIPWIRSKVDQTRYDQVLTLCKKCVEAAEKIYTPEEWQTKKKYVYELIEEKATNLGLNITDDEINALIEGFVKEIKG